MIQSTSLGVRAADTGEMRNLRFLALACLASLAAAPALAGGGTLALGLTGGTLGVGPELSLRPLDHLGVRASVNWLGFKLNEHVNDIDYNGDVGFLSFGAMADWYPYDGGLRISGGVRWNGNDIDLSARPSVNVTIGGTTYTPAEIGRLTGFVEPNVVAPLLTVGWGGHLAPGFTLGVEAGVMYQGAPKVRNLRARGGLLEGTPALLSDLKDEAQRIERKVKAYRYLPVLQLMLLYRF